MNETLIPLFATVGGALDSATNVFVQDSVARMIAVITPWTVGLVTIWLFFYGYSILAGRINQPMQEGVMEAIKIVFIVSIALHADSYLKWVVETLQSFQSVMVAVVTGNDDGTVTLWQSLDSMLGKGHSLFQACIVKSVDAGITEMGTCLSWFFAGIMIAVSFFLIVIAGGGMIFLATALLKVLFAIGPLAIMCLMFKFSRGWFDNWLGTALTYICQIVVTAGLMTVALRIFDHVISHIDLSGTSDQSIWAIVAMLLGTSLLLSFCVQESARLAGNLGGRVATEALSAARIASSAAEPGRAVRQALNPSSRRLDPTTGHQVESSRLSHLAMGRSVAVPAYRKILLERMARGWK